jgi:hypothetical protein
MTYRCVERDNTVDHADAVIGASKNASDVFIVVGAVLLVGGMVAFPFLNSLLWIIMRLEITRHYREAL